MGTALGTGAMDVHIVDAIAEAVFRANSDYELAPFDMLGEADRDLLRSVRDDPDMFGILRPKTGTGLCVKAICHETAKLFRTLQRPEPLPADLKNALGKDYPETILKLVLDGVLQIQIQGEFRSGPTAYSVLGNREPSAPQPKGHLAHLSLLALQYGQALEGLSPRELSARLYFFNRYPLSPRWKRTLPDKSAVGEHLGLNTEIVKSLLDRNWRSLPPDREYDIWFSWTSRRPAPPAANADLVYKLYVSPVMDSTRGAVQAVIEALTRHGARMWKCGADAHGLLRPDKIVAYFDTFDALGEAAEKLGRELDGCPAQGVPFTAEIGGGGLLSWGVDPPRCEQALLGGERISWRLWLTNQLAVALFGAKAAVGSELEPWQFALRRLEMDGVDTSTWSPRESIWGGNLLCKNPILS